jgi:competence protein ComEC
MYVAIILGWILGIACMGEMRWANMATSVWGMVLCNLSFWIFIHLKGVYSQQIYFRIVIATIGFSLSFILGLSYANHQLQQRLATKLQNVQDVNVVVYIRQLNQLNVDSVQQRVDVIDPRYANTTWLITQNMNQPQDAVQFELGQYYQLQGTARPIHSYANPGGFDREKWAIQQNIQATLKLNTATILEKNQLQQLGLYKELKIRNQFRHKFALSIEKQRLKIRHFIAKQPLSQRGLMLALLTGDESLLSTDTEAQFKRLGISHLLAISGPHVLLFALMLCWLLKRLIDRYFANLYLKIPRSALLLLPFNIAVLLYCAFVGFEIPALRTCIVSLTLSGLYLAKWSLPSFKILLISASILLWVDPFSVLSAAFWLSYGACFILLRIYQTAVKQHYQQQSSGLQKLWEACKLLFESQWKIFLALLPLMVIFFKQLSWITPLSNLIAIPLIGCLIVPLDIIAALAFFIFEPLAAVLFQLNDVLLGLLLAVLDRLEAIFQPRLTWVAWDGLLTLCVSMGLFILFLPRGVCPKAWSVCCFIPLFMPNDARHEFQLSILDVGQGQAIFLRQAQHNLMIDVAGYYDPLKFDVAERILLPYLAVQSSHILNQVVLTHLDTDHSGAFESLATQVEIGKVMSNERLNMMTSIPFEYCQRGQTWTWGRDVKFEVLAPTKAQLAYATFQKNESSCVILVTLTHNPIPQKILLMGDVGWQTEFELIQTYPELRADYIVLGHHGSKHSSAYDFLKHIDVKVAIISAGANNRYGHPSTETLARLDALNIEQIETQKTGEIRLILDEQGQLKPHFYRQQKMWLRPLK